MDPGNVKENGQDDQYVSEPETVAVLIPCYNEEETVGHVIRLFREHLPSAKLYVIDNNSSDRTAQVAAEHGAIVLSERRQGKGFAVDKMLFPINADFYVLVDGDNTYPVAPVLKMLNMVRSGFADMVVGNRRSSFCQTHMNWIHRTGNRLIGWLISSIFGARIQDPLSGLRVFSRKAALTLPLLARGFDIETEITIQALTRNLIIEEIDIPYKDRPETNPSKLSTFRDGFRILIRLFLLVATYKPLTAFTTIGMGFVFSGIGVGIALILGSLPQSIILTAIVVILVLLGALFCFTGAIIHILNIRINETQKILNRSALLHDVSFKTYTEHGIYK
jgi:glycosyltransferase involved in cell wall biosynthesis